MITKTKQNWTVGNTVRVGFLTLVVKAAIATPGDFLPDAYILTSVAGDKLYKFVPHNGLESITVTQVRSLMADAEDHAARVAAHAITKASSTREIDALFA